MAKLERLKWTRERVRGQRVKGGESEVLAASRLVQREALQITAELISSTPRLPPLSSSVHP